MLAYLLHAIAGRIRLSLAVNWWSSESAIILRWCGCVSVFWLELCLTLTTAL